MKGTNCTAYLIGLIWLLICPQAGAEEKLVPGKDRIDVPAIGDGLCLHNLFQSGMVLQRDKPIRIWGWAEPGENVSVTFGEKTQSSTAAADRSWKVELPALPASSEPHRLVVQGKATTIKLENILIGDVWLLGGQSNMASQAASRAASRESWLEINSASRSKPLSLLSSRRRSPRRSANSCSM